MRFSRENPTGRFTEDRLHLVEDTFLNVLMECQHEHGEIQSRCGGVMALGSVEDVPFGRNRVRTYFKHEGVDFFLNIIERQLFFLHSTDQSIEKCHARSTTGVGEISNAVFDNLERRNREYVDPTDEH